MGYPFHMRTFLGLLTTIGFLTMFTTIRAEPLAVGAQAPAVTGVTETGATLDLGAVYPKGYTLVYFFPRADTPGCTAEGCSLRDAYQDLADKGVTVIGVSTDDVAAQKAFKEKYHFPFTLIADQDRSVIKAFGVPTMGSLAHRQSFLIDKVGKIVWRDLKASTKEQAADVLKALKNLGS
jgi:peroxiredoxin Q/BCP